MPKVPSVDFPNYMNWQGQQDKRKREEHRQFENWWGTRPKKRGIEEPDAYHGQDKHSYSSNKFQSFKRQNKNNEPAIRANHQLQRTLRTNTNEVRSDYFEPKETYYQQIREELNELAFYQSRRPFKATEIPSVLQTKPEKDVTNKQKK